MITAADAIQQLADANRTGAIFTVNELRAIAASVSAASSSPNGVLYSGPMPNGAQSIQQATSIANSMGWGVIDNTERATFLGNPEFTKALNAAVKSETGLAPGIELETAVKQTLDAPGASGAYDGGRSFWSQAT
jgi:hypothetical protein